MATYAIGDIQGCYSSLMNLLDQVGFNNNSDSLWFAGDLINRGPESLETLRFIYSIKESVKVVLGNHDLHLLAIAHGHANLKKSDTIADILSAEDRDELLDWLIQQPLCHYDEKLNIIMSHAGIPPCWTLEQALSFAEEVHQLLISTNANHFFANMYGNKPDIWKDDLTGIERQRVIVNYFTRMRFCKKNGKLDLKQTGATYKDTKKGYDAWFNYPSQIPKKCQIVFGHWAAIEGKTSKKRMHALDTGCVWGSNLTALRLEDNTRFSTPYTFSQKNT